MAVASLRRNPGRKSYIVEFRHPLKLEPGGGSAGRKVRRGLGTEDPDVAGRVVEDLNKLLADPSFHTVAARAKAAGLFDARAVEIFFDGLAPRQQSYRELRNAHLPFPGGAPCALLIGAPGAGKTTLIRQLIGAHPDRDRFPATSVNRTTTADTEIIVGGDTFDAVVTFISEDEADFEVRQCVSAAVARALEADATDAEVASVFLERSDMRFRLKYVLGAWPEPDGDQDPYSSAIEETTGEAVDEDVAPIPETEAAALAALLQGYVAQMREIAAQARAEVRSAAEGEVLSDDDLIDLAQACAEQTESYGVLISQILDELKARLEAISGGRTLRTTTGWPEVWLMSMERSQRRQFLASIRDFSGNDRRRWGKLVTPLVNGVRVSGPFKSEWAGEADQPFVLIDTEGLGHKANVSADVPDHVVSRFDEADVILLVHKGDVAFGFDGGKALEALGAAGQVSKTVLVFTRMEAVQGDALRTWTEKRNHVLSGVRNVIENQISRSLTPDVARHMRAELETRPFFLGRLQQANAEGASEDLAALLQRITSSCAAADLVGLPSYSEDLLVLALQKGVEDFRRPWRGYLGLDPRAAVQPLPWQSIKAVSRRYAEGLDDGYHIRPASNLLHAMSVSVARYVENPVRWSGGGGVEERRAVLDAIKAEVSKNFVVFCQRQLRELPQAQWRDAYALRGTGSTYLRSARIEELYERWVPVPSAPDDNDDLERVQAFIDAAKTLVRDAIAKAVEPLTTIA